MMKPTEHLVRTSITLTPLVWKLAELSMDARGYNNFSAFVADLIRDYADKHGVTLKPTQSAIVYDLVSAKAVALREDPPKKPKGK